MAKCKKGNRCNDPVKKNPSRTARRTFLSQRICLLANLSVRLKRQTCQYRIDALAMIVVFGTLFPEPANMHSYYLLFSASPWSRLVLATSLDLYRVGWRR